MGPRVTDPGNGTRICTRQQQQPADLPPASEVGNSQRDPPVLMSAGERETRGRHEKVHAKGQGKTEQYPSLADPTPLIARLPLTLLARLLVPTYPPGLAGPGPVIQQQLHHRGVTLLSRNKQR